MAISTRFGKTPEANYFGASLRTMGADTRGGITPGVKADLDTMLDIAATGKAGSPERVQGYALRLVEASGAAAPAAKATVKPGAGF